MPGFLSRLFRRKAAAETKTPKGLTRSATSINGNKHSPRIDPWELISVRREDVVELLKACCDELKSRGISLLEYPFFNPFAVLPVH
jgi:hypothetical protein